MPRGTSKDKKKDAEPVDDEPEKKGLVPIFRGQVIVGWK